VKYIIAILIALTIFSSTGFPQHNKAVNSMEQLILLANQSGKPLMLIIDNKTNRPAAYSRFFKKPVWLIALYEKKFFKQVKAEFYVYFALSTNKVFESVLGQKTSTDFPAYFFFNKSGTIIYQDSGVSKEQEKYVNMFDNVRIALAGSTK